MRYYIHAVVAGTTMFGFAGADGDRWLWMVLYLPERVLEDAGGDATAYRLLEAALQSVQSGGD